MGIKVSASKIRPKDIVGKTQASFTINLLLIVVFFLTPSPSPHLLSLVVTRLMKLLIGEEANWLA